MLLWRRLRVSDVSTMAKLLDGVEVDWKALGDVANIGTGRSNKQDEHEKGEFPFYVRSKNILKSNIYQFDETAIVVPGEGGIGDIFHFVQGKYALHQRAYRINVFDNKLNSKFLYYFMYDSFKQYILSKSVGATSLSIRKPMLEKFQIPIPQPDIQAEIVRILDTSTKLTSELIAELTAELTAHKKQYNYYRDKLLSFEEGEVEWKSLGEVVKIKNGKDWKKLKKGNIPVYGSGGVMGFVDTPSYNQVSVLIPRKGTITNIFYTEEPFWNVDTIFYTIINEDIILPKYFYYFMSNYNLTSLSTDSTRPSLTQTILNKILIPIPSLSEQSKTVAILDKFDTLTNSISKSLPKEIALRQQQYEYYREQLLNFPKPDVEA